MLSVIPQSAVTPKLSGWGCILASFSGRLTKAISLLAAVLAVGGFEKLELSIGPTMHLFQLGLRSFLNPARTARSWQNAWLTVPI